MLAALQRPPTQRFSISCAANSVWPEESRTHHEGTEKLLWFEESGVDDPVSNFLEIKEPNDASPFSLLPPCLRASVVDGLQLSESALQSPHAQPTTPRHR